MASNFSAWKTVFHELFGSLPDEWNVCEANDYLPNISEVRHDGWKQFQDKGKVLFQCSVCGKRWSSVKGAVIFHYRLSLTSLNLTSREKKAGEVKLWSLGQKCNNGCRQKFEEPLWYEQEIKRVLGNMLLKVKEKFYGGPRKAVDGNQLDGNMSADHRRDLCQACQKGVCGLRDDETEYTDDYSRGAFTPRVRCVPEDFSRYENIRTSGTQDAPRAVRKTSLDQKDAGYNNDDAGLRRFKQSRNASCCVIL